MSKPKGKKWSELNAAELAEATKEFDREAPGLPGKPLTPTQKALHRKAKKMGRPRKGKGAVVVGVSIERGLLEQADAIAKARKVGRSEFFVQALLAEVSRAAASRADDGHIPFPAHKGKGAPRRAADAPTHAKAG